MNAALGFLCRPVKTSTGEGLKCECVDQGMNVYDNVRFERSCSDCVL